MVNVFVGYACSYIHANLQTKFYIKKPGSAFTCIHMYAYACVMCTTAYIYILVYAHKKIHRHIHTNVHVLSYSIFSQNLTYGFTKSISWDLFLVHLFLQAQRQHVFLGLGLPVFLRRLIIKIGGRKELVLES